LERNHLRHDLPILRPERVKAEREIAKAISLS